MIRPVRPVVLLLVAAALAAAPGAGQQVLWERTGIPDQARLLGGMAPIGDVDGDGYPEIVVGVETFTPTLDEDVLWVLSGRDGTVLRIVPGVGLSASVWRYLRIAEAGDVDADGCADYVAVIVDFQSGTPLNQSIIVEVRSGRDDRVFWRVFGSFVDQFGDAVLGGFNLDGDDRADLLMRVPDDPPNIGHIRAYSSTGALLYRIDGSFERAFFQTGSETLGWLGDFNGDGYDDFVTVGGDRATGTGAALVFCGRTGRELMRATDPQFGDNIGASVDGCGDVDRDGVLDFAAGNLSTLNGMAAIFSGATGQPIQIWRRTQPKLNGIFADGRFLRSGGHDLDRDGVPDVLAGSLGTSTAVAFSGRDGAIISIVRGQIPATRLGASVMVLDPFPGSPFPVYAVSEPSYGVFAPILDPGRIQMFRSSPVGTRTLGDPCAGTLRRAPVIGIRAHGAATQVTVHGAPEETPAALLLGTSSTSFAGQSLPLPLGPFGLRECALYTSIEAILPTVTGFEGNHSGFASFLLPGLPAAQGVDVFAQWFAFPRDGAGGGALSDAISWRLP